MALAMSQNAPYMPLKSDCFANRKDQYMAGYNTSFELTVGDIELIESALRLHKQAVSREGLDLMDTTGAVSDTVRAEQINATLSAINDLLGRLHNQKVFYRPGKAKKAPYVSG